MVSHSVGPQNESDGAPDFVSLFQAVALPLHAWAVVRLVSTIRKLVDPEDLVQEICCRAYERFSTFEPSRGSFRAWVFGIAYNVLKETMTRGSRPGDRANYPARSSAPGISAVPDETTSVLRRVARDEAFAQFLARVLELDEEDRRMVLYRGLEGMTFPEIAALTGASLSAVEKRWQRLSSRLSTFRPPSDLLNS